MSSLGFKRIALLLAVLDSGCTFYTACPTTSGNTGTGAGGTTSGGGTAGAGATVSVGGMAPTGEWANETLNLAGIPSQCGNLSYLSDKPDDDALIACVGLHGLFQMAPGDTQWAPLGEGAGSDVITNRASKILYDKDHPDVYWEAGIYNSFGVYKTTDSGNTFTNLNINHNDTVTVDFTDPDRKTMLASGHEQEHKLYITTNAGAAWSEIGDAIPAEAKVCAFPLIIDTTTFLLGCANYGGGIPGIYRSVDAGGSWTLVSSHGGGASPLIASDGTIYWAGVDTDGIVKSTDQGQTWSDPLGAGQITAVSPVELPDGRIAALGKSEVILSADQGASWVLASVEYPTSNANSACTTPPCAYAPAQLAYSNKAFHISHWTCGADTVPVPDDAIMGFAFDYMQQ